MQHLHITHRQYLHTLPKDGYAKLIAYNSVGQVVAILFNGFAQAGYVQKVTFNASNLSSGVYFSRLDFDGKTTLKKMTLLK